MYFIYILYSATSNVYYIGHTDDYKRRLEEHNTSQYTTFTSKHRPWKLAAVFKCGENRSEAIQMEQFIKKQKSRKLNKQLCDEKFNPTGCLAPLVRVPDVRD